MKQPSKVIICDCADKRFYGFGNEPIDCILQDREIDDDSRVVYVENPNYVQGSKNIAPYVAFTRQEYIAVEYSEYVEPIKT